MYNIVKTESFKKLFHKLIPKNLQGDIERRIRKLSENPYNSKLLTERLREIKADKFRIYFVIIESKVLIVFVGVSDKKDQQRMIDSLKEFDFEKYKNFGV